MSDVQVKTTKNLTVVLTHDEAMAIRDWVVGSSTSQMRTILTKEQVSLLIYLLADIDKEVNRS